MDSIQQHIPEVVAVAGAVFALMLPTWILGFLCKWVILGMAALNLAFTVYDRVRDKVKPFADGRGRYAVVTGKDLNWCQAKVSSSMFDIGIISDLKVFEIDVEIRLLV